MIARSHGVRLKQGTLASSSGYSVVAMAFRANQPRILGDTNCKPKRCSFETS